MKHHHGDEDSHHTMSPEGHKRMLEDMKNEDSHEDEESDHDY